MSKLLGEEELNRSPLSIVILLSLNNVAQCNTKYLNLILYDVLYIGVCCCNRKL